MTCWHRSRLALGPTFAEFARHYGLAVILALSGQVRDTGIVESTVQTIHTRVLAPLRSTTFLDRGLKLSIAVHPIDKERSKRLKPAEITSVILRPDGLQIPNRQRKAMYELRRQLTEKHSSRDMSKLKAQLHGREAQMNQVMSEQRRLRKSGCREH